MNHQIIRCVQRLAIVTAHKYSRATGFRNLTQRSIAAICTTTCDQAIARIEALSTVVSKATRIRLEDLN